MDSGLHFIYFLNAAKQPVCLRKKAGRWMSEAMGEEPVSLLLGVDERLHRVFAYDEAARGIRVYHFSSRTRMWTSEVVAAGLGRAGDAGAVDAARGLIYTVHESADETIPRSEGLPPPLPADDDKALKPWPMVETKWKDGQWASRVICDTGVPQQPAVENTDGSVFFARRGGLRDVHRFKPARGQSPEAVEVISGWSGADTYVDHAYYKIRAPRYPKPWLNNGSSSTFAAGSMSLSWGGGVAIPMVALTAPIAVVPYYEPIWTDTPLEPRIAHFRAMVNPRQKRLVQHRQVYRGEIIREQTGMRHLGYVYKDANGTIVRQLYDSGPYARWDTSRSYGALGPEFDPENPPSHFGELAKAGRQFAAHQWEVVGWLISAECTIDPESPWIATHLREPTSVSLRTFGHHYGSGTMDQRGGRYSDYRDKYTRQAISSSIAVDRRTGMTFYTQSQSSTQPQVTSNDDTTTLHLQGGVTAIFQKGKLITFGGKSFSPGENASLSAFHSLEAKFSRPLYQQVWIVVVY